MWKAFPKKTTSLLEQPCMTTNLSPVGLPSLRWLAAVALTAHGLFFMMPVRADATL